MIPAVIATISNDETTEMMIPIRFFLLIRVGESDASSSSDESAGSMEGGCVIRLDKTVVDCADGEADDEPAESESRPTRACCS